jgi:hypothetical protein
MIAPTLFHIILGEKWLISGKMAIWIVLWGTAFLLALPYRVCYRVLRWQKVQLLVDAFVLSVIILLFYGFSNLSPLTMIKCISISGILQNIVLLTLMYLKLKKLSPHR